MDGSRARLSGRSRWIGTCENRMVRPKNVAREPRGCGRKPTTLSQRRSATLVDNRNWRIARRQDHD